MAHSDDRYIESDRSCMCLSNAPIRSEVVQRQDKGVSNPQPDAGKRRFDPDPAIALTAETMSLSA